MRIKLYSLIQTFQTLFVGIIGFVGVIVTLWLNASQSRRQRADERGHERETLRVALIEELKIIRKSLVQNIEGAPEHEGGAAFVPTDPMDDAYRAFTHKIGLLSQEEVQKVMYAYLTLRTYNAKLFLIGVPPHTGDRHVQVPSNNIALLNQMQNSLITPIDEAIHAMERATTAPSPVGSAP